MRNLKYRARIKGTNIWLTDFGFHFTDLTQVFCGESQYEWLDEETLDKYGEHYDEIMYFKVDAFCEWTGLKDKNGKEIYEGDIVKYEASKGQFGLHQIVYVDEAAAFLLQAITPASRNPVGMKYLGDIARSNSQYDTRTYELCEAIGNIYQNKELLNDQQ